MIEYLLAGQGRPEAGAAPGGPPAGGAAPFPIKRFTDEMPGGFFIYRADGGEEILYANQAMLRLCGCGSMEEFRALTGGSFRGLVHPEDLDAVEESIWAQIRQSKYDLDYVEYRIVQRGGQVRWVEDYGHFTHSDAVGDIFYVFVGDATEKRQRQQAEQAAMLEATHQKEQTLQSQIDAYHRELEELYREQSRRLELIEGLSIDYEAIFYVDLDEDQIQPYRVSRRMEYQFGEDHQVRRFTGFAAEYIAAWVHPEDRARFSRALSPEDIRKQLARQKSFHIDYRIRKDGKTEYLLLCVVNVGHMEPASQIVLGCRSVDGEVRREMEQNRLLEDALSRAKVASSVKDTFLANMSHDIRTPMNAIMGFTALAKRHMGDGARLQDYLDMLEAAGSQLLHLMDDVLELSRLGSGAVRIQEAPCSLLDLAEDIRAEILPRAEAGGIGFSTDLTGLAHPYVYADRENLTQILLRLAGNAVKYTRQGGWVALVFEEQKRSRDYAAYQFSVKDSGVGISEGFLSHVFEPFEREKNTTLSGVQGTGLGLTIAKSIVEMMGGSIDVSSAPNQGSCFTVTISLRLQDRPAVGPGPAGAGPEIGAAPGRILLVEDNEINREIEVELLEDAGFLVDTAEDGSVALDRVRACPPGTYALILMDIQMPVMDGHSAARAIRALEDPGRAGIPIVALSANAFAEDKKMSLASGMNAHLAKPINVTQLISVIEELIQGGGR